MQEPQQSSQLENDLLYRREHWLKRARVFHGRAVMVFIGLVA